MEGASIDLLPRLNKPENFIFWKKHFEVFVKSKSLRLWRIIEFGDYIPRKVSPGENGTIVTTESECKNGMIVTPESECENGMIVTRENECENGMIVKPESEWSKEDETKVRQNSLAIHLLYCALPEKDQKLIFRCDTAHDIWATLDMIHEGNFQLKDYKINLLTQKFETFQMFKNKSIDNMYERYNNIISTLTALGKTYTNERYVVRFLSALPAKWNVKVNSILENKNLSALSLEEHIGDLKVFEIVTLKRYEWEDQERRKCFRMMSEI